MRSDPTKHTVTFRNCENGPKISLTKRMYRKHQILYMAQWTWFDFTIVYISYRYSGLKYVLTVLSKVRLMATSGLNEIMYIYIYL